ncbi:MAG: hypothetical protein J6Z08_06145 [Elusimicrobiales bacterium]|nr:hypothetical protein [Elusimicrobiales bacterium]
MNILLVDDDKQEFETWNLRLHTDCEKLQKEHNIELFNARDSKEAEDKIKSGEIEFLIVDLKLANNSNGKDFLQTIQKYGWRIPTVIYTGTPDEGQDEKYVLKIYKKGDTGIPEILDDIISIYDTGITEVLSRDGLVQNIINKFYQEIFINNMDLWIRRQQENSNKTMVQRSLLKILLNNLNAHIDYDEDKAYSEQFYIYPFSNNSISTGSILKVKNSEKYFLLISPACDMVLRPQKDGSKKRKLENLHLLSVIQNPQCNNNKKAEKDMKTNKNGKYHYLPKINNFEGGYVDFADINLCKYEDIENDYSVVYKITDQFMKNIISRFAAYFARQGQPDLFPEGK